MAALIAGYYDRYAWESWESEAMIQGSISEKIGLSNAFKSGASRSADREDPVVAARVDFVQSQTQEGRSSSTYIAETLADDNLTRQQKNEFIAQVIELAGGSDVGEGALSVSEQHTLRLSLEEIGAGLVPESEDVDAGEAQTSAQQAIRDGVRSGRLDADDIYNVVSPDIRISTTGTRELLSTIGDPAVFDEVSTRLLADAQREGYDINNNENGAFILTNAADFANMAADLSQRGQYYPGASRAIIDEIARVESLGPVSGDLTLTDVLLQTEINPGAIGHGETIPERGAFAVFSEIINSAGNLSGAREFAADKLFSELVRSQGGAPGGIDASPDRSEGINELGIYLTDNLERLTVLDWENANTDNSTSGESFYNFLLADGIENVILHDDFTRQEQFADAAANYIVDLAEVAGDPNASDGEKLRAAESLGTFAGSLNVAADNHVNNAGEDSQKLRVLTDFLTDKLISTASAKAGSAGPVVSAGGNAVVDAIWQNIEDSARSGARGEVDDAVGGIRVLLADIRDALGEEADPRSASDFDNREIWYHPGR